MPRRSAVTILLSVTTLCGLGFAGSPLPAQADGPRRMSLLGGGATRVGPAGATSTGGGLITAFASGLMFTSINATAYSANGTTSIAMDTQFGLMLIHRAAPGKTALGLAVSGGLYRSVRPVGDLMLTVGGSAMVGFGSSPIGVVLQGAAVIPPEGDPSPLLRAGLGIRL